MNAEHLTLLSIGVLLTAHLAFAIPRALVATGLLLSVSGGAWTALLIPGYSLILAGALGLAARKVKRASGNNVAPQWLQLALILWIAATSLLSGGGVLLALVACTIAVVAGGYYPQLERTLGNASAIALVVVWSTHLTSDSTVRLTGFSGNPNRLSFGICLLLPFALAAFRAHNIGSRIARISIYSIAVHAVYLTASRQGLSVVLAIGLFELARMLPKRAGLFLALTIIATTVSATLFAPLSGVESDVATLGDRTAFYKAAIQTIAANPVFGTGETHVAGFGLEGSAHSTPLALAAQSGIPAGLMWVVLLAITGARIARMPLGQPLQVAAFSLIALQFVQNLQFQPLVWFIFAAVASTSSQREVSANDGLQNRSTSPHRPRIKQLLPPRGRSREADAGNPRVPRSQLRDKSDNETRSVNSET